MTGTGRSVHSTAPVRTTSGMDRDEHTPTRSTPPPLPTPSRASARTHAHTRHSSKQTHNDDGEGERDEKGAGAGPWQHMAQTYAWVAEQESLKRAARGERAAQWVLEQQIFFASPHPKHSNKAQEHPKEQSWEALVCGWELQAERWMQHEESVRRAAAAAEQEKERARRRRAAVVQEEVRRAEARVRLRLTEHHTKPHREQQHDHQSAYVTYQHLWSTLSTSHGPLTFASIPWPLATAPTNVAGITAPGIVMFLFSGMGKGESRKERVRGAQLRWHPDRFRRVLGRVVEGDKGAVEEGAGVVARCLNDLMAREAAVLRVSH